MKEIAKVWKFESASNPNKSYETLQYEDGSTSCNCPGWCRRVDKKGNRSCRHTRAVDMGTADEECTSSHSYQSGKKAQTAKPKPQVKTPQEITTPVVRKIQWQ